MVDYDFSIFAGTLLGLSPNQMLFSVEEELEALPSVRHDDPMIRFRREDYERKLFRLRMFLRTGRVPEALTPKESQAYQQIAMRLLSLGVTTPVLFELRDRGFSRSSIAYRQRSRGERRRAERRISCVGYAGPERRRGTDRRSGLNRRKVQLFNSM